MLLSAREAAEEFLKERVNIHFSALNDLVKLSMRPDSGNIVLIMPWYGRGYGLRTSTDDPGSRDFAEVEIRH